jgi:predicted RNA-binding protein YlxR (DUF448 family)
VTSHDSSQASGPVRTCIGCREQVAKRELLRVTLRLDDNGQPAVVPDPEGTAPGRGAHLHPTTACLDLAERRRAFARAFRQGKGTRSPVTDAVRELLTLSETE